MILRECGVVVSHVLRMYKAPGSNPGTSSTFWFRRIKIRLMKNSFIRMINRNTEADKIKKTNYFSDPKCHKVEAKNLLNVSKS